MKRAAICAACIPPALLAVSIVGQAVWVTLVYRMACRERGERPATLDFVLNGIMLGR